MTAQKESPALTARGVPEVSLAAGKIDPESISSLRKLQASRLARRCDITFTMACIVVPILHGEGNVR